MKWYFVIILGYMFNSYADAITLEEQYKGLVDCRANGVYFDSKRLTFGPGAIYFKENKPILYMEFKEQNLAFFSLPRPDYFHGLKVRELHLPYKEGISFGLSFYDNKKKVTLTLSKIFQLGKKGNQDHLPYVDVWSDGVAYISCDLDSNYSGKH